MASRSVKLIFRLLLAAAAVMALYYVGRPLYWKISATVHEIRHNKQTVSGGFTSSLFLCDFWLSNECVLELNLKFISLWVLNQSFRNSLIVFIFAFYVFDIKTCIELRLFLLTSWLEFLVLDQFDCNACWIDLGTWKKEYFFFIIITSRGGESIIAYKLGEGGWDQWAKEPGLEKEIYFSRLSVILTVSSFFVFFSSSSHLWYAGISQIVQEAQKSVGWFHDGSDSGLQEDKKWVSARRFLLGQVLWHVHFYSFYIFVHEMIMQNGLYQYSRLFMLLKKYLVLHSNQRVSRKMDL